jgi:excinuclease ABC subunit B
MGRAARNADGRVILYADRITDSMAKATAETDRRRAIQTAYNTEHKITPTTIVKETANHILDALRGRQDQIEHSGATSSGGVKRNASGEGFTYGGVDLPQVIKKLEKEMKEAAKSLDFERAAELRDQLQNLQDQVQRKRSGSGMAPQ